MSEPKYCVNCVHYREDGQRCARNAKGGVSLVTGLNYEYIGRSCESERRAGMWPKPANFDLVFMSPGLRRMVRGGDCGPAAKFFEPLPALDTPTPAEPRSAAGQ